MPNTKKEKIKTISQIINEYVSSLKIESIEELEKEFSKLLNADYAKMIRFDQNRKVLFPLRNHNESLSLEKSIIQQAIISQHIIIADHIISDKFYNPVVDNPEHFKIKAMMVIPVIHKTNTYGILCIQKGINNRSNFTKQDEILIKPFIPLLVKCFQGERIEQSELQVLMSREERVVKQQKKEVTKVSTNAATKVSKSESEEISQLTQSFNEELQILRQTLEEALQKNRELEESLKEKEKVCSQLKDIEVSSEELMISNQTYQKHLMEMEDKYASLKKDYEEIRHELKAEKEKSIHDFNTLKKEKSLKSHVHDSVNFKNPEMFLSEMDMHFGVHEYAYTLFEILLYSLESEKGLSYMEETIQKTKIVSEILKGYYFNGDVKVHHEKYHMANLIQKIREYEKNVFPNSFKLNPTMNDETPVSLVLDAPKIQSIILHLLTDMHNFVDYDVPLNIDISFHDKVLSIILQGRIHPQNNFIKSIFKHSTFVLDEKQRMGMSVSKKLIERLKGTIETSYNDDSCIYKIHLPVEVIKY